MNAVLVSHPHAAAVSVAVATAFESAGSLATLVTGLAGTGSSRVGKLLKLASAYRPELSNRVVQGVDPAHICSLGAMELLTRAIARGAKLLTEGRLKPYDVIYVVHDTLVAALPWPAKVDTIYAYEDAALRTFLRAKKEELQCILDLPAICWESVQALLIDESERWPGAAGLGPPLEPAWKQHRKNKEIELADVISVASSNTRDSLEWLGCRKPIVVTPYPFPINQFKARAMAPSGPFTVLSVGAHDLRKGTPYLLEAWRRAALKDARLKLIGGLQLSRGFLEDYAGLFEHTPWLPKVHIELEYQAADVLVFPTLGDGFGLVIQEAMCCGTPVVTTRRGGGPECITDGEDGVIIEERSVEALVEALRWAATNRDRLYAMGIAARRRAENYDSVAFGPRLVGGLRQALAVHQSSA